MTRAERRRTLNHSLSRTLAALLGSIPLSLATGAALALALPLGASERYLIGSFSVFPIWVGASTSIFLAGSGKRAWFLLSALFVLALVMALIAGVLRARTAA